MNDTFTAGADNFVTGVATDLDNPTVRPVIPTRTQEIEERLAHADAAIDRTQRQLEMQRLTIEALIAKAWHERLRQMRGETPEIGTRDMHVKNGLIKALMTITADNANLSLEEYSNL